MSANEALLPRSGRSLGRYELISRIGAGGMAEVQLALQRGPAGFEKLVVVKLIHEHLATQKPIVDMLLAEARVAALVKHPNVVDIYDLGEVDGTYFIAMEYLEGEPLLSLLRAGRDGKRLDPLSTARMIADAAEGLDAAHELRSLGGDPIELVHHDVSLGNIVVLYNGQVKLVDFGVAKAQRAAGERGGRNVGKYGYMAPEKLLGGAGDRRSDIFSLGVVLWEALTLRRLFRGGNDEETRKHVLETTIAVPSSVNPEISAELDAICMAALAHDPEQRFQTASAMANALEDVLTEQRYGRKNDAIAKYMQDTFKSHIVARRQLLQEVSSKGAASAAVLEAAFAEPILAAGTQPHDAPAAQEFSVRFKRATVEMSVPAAPESIADIVSGRLERPLAEEIDGMDELGAHSLADSALARVAMPGASGSSTNMLGKLLGNAEDLAGLASLERLEGLEGGSPGAVPTGKVTVAKPARRWWLLVLALVIVLGGGAVAAYFFLLG